jgi:hypothetical protein
VAYQRDQHKDGKDKAKKYEARKIDNGHSSVKKERRKKLN